MVLLLRSSDGPSFYVSVAGKELGLGIVDPVRALERGRRRPARWSNGVQEIALC